MYDIFVIGNNLNWKKIKNKYPFAKKATDFKEAKSKSLTPMFWAVWDDIDLKEDFDFTINLPKWDEEYVHVWKNADFYDGLSLIPKNKHISDKEVKYRFFTDKKEIDLVASEPKKYDVFEIETYEQYLEAMDKSTTDMFWMTSPNLKVADDFKFDLYITHHNAYERQENHAFVHLVNGEKLYNGIFLLSKHKPVSKKEIEHRYIIERKEWDIVASGPCEYDKFLVDTYEQYLEAKSKSRTEMFWVIASDVKVLDDFKFDLYFEHNNIYDREINHIFKNSEFYDGLMLLPRSKEISKKEFDYSSIVDKKEYDVLASLPKKFDKFNITTYQDYLDACETSTTGMFWAIWSDVELVEDFDFDYYVPRYNRHLPHVFRNGDYFDGVCLFSKYHKVTEKEFKYRFFSDKKEIDYIISYPKKYDIFEIETYDQYLEAIKNSNTDLFWMTSPNLKVADDFKFNFQGTRFENHAFVHLVNDEKLYNGIFLLSKHRPVTQKEIEHRYIIERKEWDIVASEACQYDVFEIDTYEQYLEAMKMSKTEMFWMTSPNLKVADDFKFDVYFSHEKIYDRSENHTFIHLVGEERLYNGVFLLSKNKPITKKEIEHRYIIERKEWDIVASGPCQYDKFIVDTYEQYVEAKAKSRTEMFWAIPSDVNLHPDFKFDVYYQHDKIFERTVHHAYLNGAFYDGVFLITKHAEISKKEFDNKFILARMEEETIASDPIKFDVYYINSYNEYLEACETSTTNMFWCVWPDVEVVEDFDFDYYVPRYNQHITHIFKNDIHFDGICLFSKDHKVTEKEFNYRFFSEKKEVDYVISYPKKYDIFEIDTYEQYLEAMDKSITDLFWMTTANLKPADDFNFDLYITHHNAYERQENHAFVHLVEEEKLYNGVFLLSKKKPVSKREIENRYIMERKEWDIVASGPCEYDKFVVDTYEQYVEAKAKSRTEMFWAIPSGVTVLDDFKFDLYFEHNNIYDRMMTHIFRNSEFHDGVMLITKNREISQREFDYGFIVARKEYDVLASVPKQFDKFNITTYQDYLDACEQSTTGMFWAVWSDVELVEDFDFDYYVPRYNQHLPHVFKNGDYFDGICLFSKYHKVTEKEFKYRFFNDKKEIDYIISYPKKYDIFEIETYDQYLEAMDKSTTDLFWMTSPNLQPVNDFKFDLYITHHNAYERQENHAFVHLVNDKKLYNGIFLLSKHKTVSKKEIEHRYIVERKEWDIVASGPCQYDKFVADTYEQYLEAKAKSRTEMFWVTHSNINVLDDFKFDLYFDHDNVYDRNITHIFRNSEFYDGLMLMPKSKDISQREFDYGFIVDRKEYDILASLPKKFDKFNITTYQDYLDACENSTTGMFWAVWPDVDIVEDFDFDYYVPKYNYHITHVFRNDEHFDGVCLFSKYHKVTEKEFKYRFFNDKKEIDYIISYPKKYDIFEIDTYQQYLEAMDKSTTDLFWMTTANLKPADDFNFDLYISHHNFYERRENHAFIHRVNGEDLYNGIFLLSKNKPISEKEVTFRYLIERKEWDIVASGPCEYDKFVVDTYQDYQNALSNSRTEMFWMIPSEVEPIDNFKFDIYFQHHNTYDRTINHSFKHLFRGEENFNGICLMSKSIPVGEKEINYRYLVERKEWDVVASKMKPYDIVFISYNEVNADATFEKLKNLYPRIKRVHGVKGIHQAHIKAAELSQTENFWVVDGDAEIVDDFNFDYEIPVWERDTVHVWRSRNPINNLVYGYGGVKLLPKQLTLNMDVTRPDMTTSISKNFKPVQVISNITAFNTDEFSTWKSAFRECAKLAGKAIDRQVDAETEERLNVWCTQGADKLYGEYAIKGAQAGRKFATEQPENLFKINDFEWLYEQYEKDNSK